MSTKPTPPTLLRSASRMVAAGALAGVCFTLADTYARSDWNEVSLARHLSASAWLWVAWGVGIGLGVAALEVAAQALSALLRRLKPSRAALPMWRRADVLVPLVLVAFLVGWGAQALLGPLVSHGKGAQLKPLTWPLGLGLGFAALVGWGIVQRAGRSARPLRVLGCAALFFGLAAVSILLDLTLLVSLYASLHTLLESIALVSLMAGHWCLLAALERRVPRSVPWVSGAAVAAVAGLLVLPFFRSMLFNQLKPAWREPVYVGRLMARVQTVEDRIRGGVGAESAGMARLRQTYDLTVTGQDPAWLQPSSLTPEVEQALAALRPEPEQLNVLVYYIDTLRADVARDPALMPNAVKFCEESLCFDFAYSAASDTVSTLPVALGGRFGGELKAPATLDQAEASGRETTLFIPRSAAEFLERELPSFRFKRVERVPDYHPGEQVWGYGATRPTAARLVDRAIETLFEPRPAFEPRLEAALAELPSARPASGSGERGAPLGLGELRSGELTSAELPIGAAPLGEREDAPPASQAFFSWVFNFDVHNWRELDQEYIDERARTLGVSGAEDERFRYFVAARAVDEEFGRLLRELERRGLKERTLVVLMADHGEALGRHGFWVHSTFLWESLVRVPLAIRMPGIAPRHVKTPVSLVDLGPTLVRALAPERSLAGYHGEDLLVHALPTPPARRLPILLEGWHKTERQRIGLVDAEQRMKLVIPLESGVPELHHIDDLDPEATERSGQEEGRVVSLLNQLVSSPAFPRPKAADPGVAQTE